MTNLLDAVLTQKDKWLDQAPSPCGKNAWIEAKEGKIYIRWNSAWRQFDLASIDIDPEFQDQRVFTKILKAVCADRRIEKVRIESVLNNRFFERLQQRLIPGRETVTSPHEHQTVDFVLWTGRGVGDWIQRQLAKAEKAGSPICAPCPVEFGSAKCIGSKDRECVALRQQCGARETEERDQDD